MPLKTFILEIITPEKKILKEEVAEIVLNAVDGKLGILPNHAPLCTMLSKGKILIKYNNGEVKIFQGDDGVLLVKNNIVSIHTKTVSE